MLKEHSFLVRQLVALVDFIALAVVFYYSHRVVSLHASLKPVTEYWFMFIGFLVFYGYFAWTRHLFSLLQFPVMGDLARRTLLIFASAGMIGAAILYLFPDFHNSRRLYLTFVCFSCVAITAGKEVLRLMLYWLRRHGRNTTPVMVFGRGRELSQLVKQVETNRHWGLRIRQQLDLDTTPEVFERLLLNSHVEQVFLCVPRSATDSGFDLAPYLQVCEEAGRPARVFLNLHSIAPETRWQYQPFMGRPTMVSHTAELDPDQLLIKRALDIGCALAACGLTLLLMPLLASAIRLDSPGPAVVRRERLGKGGKRFRMYAFRCEREPTDSGRGTLSRVGRVVRALGLEQLPAFYNVLRGEMSLVGVRPAAPHELEQYLNWYHRRLAHRPGITGLWRVNPTGDETLDELVRLDLSYAEHWSVLFDMGVALRTCFGLCGGPGPWIAPASISGGTS